MVTTAQSPSAKLRCCSLGTRSTLRSSTRADARPIVAIALNGLKKRFGTISKPCPASVQVCVNHAKLQENSGLRTLVRLKGELMTVPTAEAFFAPEQRAAIRTLLPAGASVEAILCAMHTIGELAALEATSPRLGPAVSFRERRDDCVRFMKMTQAFAQALLKNRPPRRTPEADWYTLVLRGLGHLHAEAVDTAATLDFMVKQNSGRKNSHREMIYTHLLHIWTSLGGSLYLYAHNQAHEGGKASGPVIPYLKLVVSLIFDEPPLPDGTIVDAVRREIDRRKGKPPRKRKRRRK